MRIILRLQLCSTIFVALAFGQTGELPINPTILSNVVKISTPSARFGGKKATGSGFIVSQLVTDKHDTARVYFLVTNKHMVSDWTLVDSTISQYNAYLEVSFYTKKQTGSQAFKIRRIPLLNQMGQDQNDIVEPHPSPTVDVCLVFLGNDILSDSDIVMNSFDFSYLRPFDFITTVSFNIGSQVYVLGYPLGITSLRNSYPIAKSGFLASVPGEQFSIVIQDTSRTGMLLTKTLQGKLLIVDGLIVHGNSGGPVILPSVVKTRIDSATGSWQYKTKPTENNVIGILSGGFGDSGLSYVFSSDYVLETINKFLQRHSWNAVK